jgi:hypothetical protein
MNEIMAWLKSIRSNPIFVAGWTAFAGAFGSEVMTAYTTGKLDFSLQSWQKMAESAALTATLALIHLYFPQPNPTVAATFPPSKTPVDVPAQLEPVDPKAVPVNPPQAVANPPKTK